MTEAGKENSRMSPVPFSAKWGMSPFLSLVLAVVGCARPLPEAGSDAAAVYEARCGSCHRAANPASMKYAVWEMVLPRMEQRIHEAHLPPLSDEERSTISAYLKRNAG